MKKFLSLVIAMVILVGIFIAVSAQAGSVGDRAFFSGATNCIGLWTNTYNYAAVELKRVRVEKSLSTTNAVVFYRITSGSSTVYTNAIGTVTCASGVGVQATLTASSLLYGDIVKAVGRDEATGAASNTYSAWLEFEVQQH